MICTWYLAWIPLVIFQNCLNDNFEISLVVFIPNIITNHAITYTYTIIQLQWGKNIYKNSQWLSPETHLYDITTSLVTSRLNKLRWSLISSYYDIDHCKLMILIKNGKDWQRSSSEPHFVWYNYITRDLSRDLSRK